METFTDYLKVIEETLNRLNNATNLQWHHEWTGGNCDALILPTDEDHHSYYMVTVDASAPTTNDEWQNITLGYYAPNNYDGTIIESVTSWDSLVDYFTDGNPHPVEVPYVEPCDECGAEMTSTGDGWIHANTPDSHKCYTAYRWGVK